MLPTVLLLLVSAGPVGGALYIEDEAGLRTLSHPYPDQLQPSEWQIRLYRHGADTSGKGYWGLITGKTASEVTARLRESQAFELAARKFFGIDTPEPCTYFNPLGPIAKFKSKGPRGLPEAILKLDERLSSMKKVVTRLERLLGSKLPRVKLSPGLTDYLKKVKKAAEEAAKLNTEIAQTVNPTLKEIERGLEQINQQLGPADSLLRSGRALAQEALGDSQLGLDSAPHESRFSGDYTHDRWGYHVTKTFTHRVWVAGGRLWIEQTAHHDSTHTELDTGVQRSGSPPDVRYRASMKLSDFEGARYGHRDLGISSAPAYVIYLDSRQPLDFEVAEGELSLVPRMVTVTVSDEAFAQARVEELSSLVRPPVKLDDEAATRAEKVATAAYASALGREPSAAEVEALIARGGADPRRALIASEEFAQAAEAMYREALQRAPTPEELASTRARVSRSPTSSLAQVRLELFNGPEAKKAIDQLWRDVAGRAPSAKERAEAEAVLRSGQPTQVLRERVAATPDVRGKSALDCATRFFRRGVVARFVTAQDLRAAFLLHRGNAKELPSDPEKADEVENIRNETVPLEVVAHRDAAGRWVGPDLLPGDLVVSRLPWDSGGLVYVVQRFDPVLTQLWGIAFDEKKGTEYELEGFAMSTDPPNGPERLMRPGYFALRLRSKILCPSER